MTRRPPAMLPHLFLVLVLLGAVAPPAPAAADPSASAETAEPASPPSPIRSGCEPDYPPFCFTDPRGHAAGFSVELFRAALHAMGRRAGFRVAPWNDLKEALARGDLEALPLVGRTPEREAVYDFTVPYLTMHGAVVVRDGTEGIAGLDDLRGRTVAVMKGDNAEEFLRREERGVTIATFPTFVDAFHLLAAGGCDAVVIQRLVALRLLAESGVPGLRLLPDPIRAFRQEFCFAVRKGNSDTLALLNEGLALAMADGTYRQLHAKWFAALELPERARLRFGGDRDYPPFEFIGENGEPAGFNVDLIRAVARAAGFDYELALDDWGRVRRRLEAGELDATLGMLHSPERGTRLDFAPPHATVHHVAVTRAGEREPPASFDALAGLRVAVAGDDLMHDLLSGRGFGGRLAALPTVEDALAGLASGAHDVAVVPRRAAFAWMERHGAGRLAVGAASLHAADLCFAVPKGRRALLALYEEGLSAVAASGELRSLRERWLGVREEPQTLARALRYAAVVVVPLLAATLLFALWSWGLRREVERRTAELRESERLLAASRDELRSILDASNDAIFVDDAATGRFLDVNHATCEMYRMGREELLAADLNALSLGEPPYSQSDALTHLSRARTEGPQTFPWRARRGDGTLFWAEVSIRFATIGGGERFVVVVRDIDERMAREAERERLAARLAQTERLETVGRLAGGVAHDFNNMLCVVLGTADMLLETADPSPRLRDGLSEIRSAAERAALVVKQLLGFAGREMIAPRLLPLDDAVADSRWLLQKLCAERVGFSMIPGAPDARVVMDPTQLERVLVNLCLNARDACADGGRVTVETAVAETAGDGGRRMAVIMVRDDGRGMDGATRARLFEPFFSTKAPGAGGGLGLATVYGIVKQNGGEITVESAPGEGTVVTVRLPLAPGASGPPDSAGIEPRRDTEERP